MKECTLLAIPLLKTMLKTYYNSYTIKKNDLLTSSVRNCYAVFYN